MFWSLNSNPQYNPTSFCIKEMQNSDVLNKNSLAVKRDNPKQHCSYGYKGPKPLISGKKMNDIQ